MNTDYDTINEHSDYDTVVEVLLAAQRLVHTVGHLPQLQPMNVVYQQHQLDSTADVGSSLTSQSDIHLSLHDPTPGINTISRSNTLHHIHHQSVVITVTTGQLYWSSQTVHYWSVVLVISDSPLLVSRTGHLRQSTTGQLYRSSQTHYWSVVLVISDSPLLVSVITVSTSRSGHTEWSTIC